MKPTMNRHCAQFLFRLKKIYSIPVAFFKNFFFFSFLLFGKLIAVELFHTNKKKKKTPAITSPNMKYKIQNHFTHSDAQVFLHKSAFPYSFSMWKVAEQTSHSEPTETERDGECMSIIKKNLPQSFHLNDWIVMAELKYVVFETYVGCRQETDFNVCIFYMPFEWLLYNFVHVWTFKMAKNEPQTKEP